MGPKDTFMSSIECGMVCVGVSDIQSRLVCLKEHEQKYISRDLSYGILNAVFEVEGTCLWVDSGDPGLELILYERASDAIRAAGQIARTANVASDGGELGLRVAVHWGQLVLNNDNLKVFGPNIQDVKTLQEQSTTGAPTISPECIAAAEQQRRCGELSDRSWVFISYSHADNKRPNFVEELLQQMRPYEALGKLGVFVDTRIRPGEPWFRTIMANLTNHRVAVLLVGPGFFASDFIRDAELPSIQQAYTKRGLKVLWVYLIETSFLSQSWIRELQAAHDPPKPVAERGRVQRHGVWAQVVTKITENAGPAIR